jgi:hypothetical protein
MYESDRDSLEDESEEFCNLVLGPAQVAQKYFDMLIDKNPQKIANTSDYGWLIETRLRVNVINNFV